MTDLNRRFADLIDLCWHIDGYDPNDSYLRVPRCPKCQIELKQDFHNPDFISDPRLVLREMMKKKGFGNFLYHLCTGKGMSHEDRLLFVLYDLVPVDYMLDTAVG